MIIICLAISEAVFSLFSFAFSVLLFAFLFFSLCFVFLNRLYVINVGCKLHIKNCPHACNACLTLLIFPITYGMSKLHIRVYIVAISFAQRFARPRLRVVSLANKHVTIMFTSILIVLLSQNIKVFVNEINNTHLSNRQVILISQSSWLENWLVSGEVPLSYTAKKRKNE